MKKNVVILIALLFIGGITAQAQLKYGLKAGVNISKADFDTKVIDSNVEDLTGFQVGPMIEFMVPIIGIGFDASLLYSQQGFKIKSIIDEKSYKTNTLDIPVNLKYKLTFMDVAGAYLAAGPYASFNLSDNFKNTVEAKTFGAGLNFGLGVELLGSLQIGASYKLGLTDDYSTLSSTNEYGIEMPSFKGTQSGWTISAAYFF